MRTISTVVDQLTRDRRGGIDSSLQSGSRPIPSLLFHMRFRAIRPEHSQFGVWLGAKAFCAPSVRQHQDQLWISKDDWFEQGPAVVDRKVKEQIERECDVSGWKQK